MDSFSDFTLNKTIETRLNSSCYINFENGSYRSAEDEMVNFFYKAMLKTIVQTLEVTVQESVDSIASGDRCFINANLDYKQACDDEELMEKEYEHNDTTLESFSFIGQVPSKRRTLSLMKRQKRLQRRSKTKKKSIGTPKYSALISPSQLKYNLDDEDIDEYVVVKFKNGNVYTGPTYMKMFHGVGEYRWADGTVYKGNFLNGQMTGSGSYTYTDLSIYEGEVFKGYPHGLGKYFIRHSSTAYSGQWYLGMKQGSGCIHFTYSDWYDGFWKADCMQGVGTRYYPSGSKYQGEFFAGKRHGNGQALLSNKDIYTGQWVEGQRSGFGEYIWKPYHKCCFCVPIQNIYIGMWKQDCMHGKGELNFGTLNGSRYIGHFYYNQKHGGGLIICENGALFNCSPMFAENKPIKYTADGKLENLECSYLRPLSVAHTPQISTPWVSKPSESYEKNLKAESSIFRFPSTTLHKRVRATINLCKLEFKRKPEKLFPIKIPLWAPAEEINLDPVIRPFLQMIHGCATLEKSDSFIVQPNTWEHFGIQTSRANIKYDYEEIQNIEEKALRRAIQINLQRLKEIYNHYSLIGCLKKLPYDTLMNRLFLWQMFRDCKISEKGISISYIDALLAEDTICFSESIHDPFENIYFWQFLTVLVKTSWEIYGSKYIKYIFEGRSILEPLFTKFLNEDIFPNAGHHFGYALFDYKDILPLKATYNWYRSIEEPMTIQTFILNIFSLNSKETHHYEPIPKEVYINPGVNIPIGNNIVFLFDEEPKFGVSAEQKNLIPIATKCLEKKLYFLHELGRKFIYSKIKSVVPGIFTNRECFNHNYKLCFLEFYEIVLICTQHILKKEENKLKKTATITTNNNNMLLKITKKSKQYRKSASHYSMTKRHTP